jgi:hypothetical protein
MANPGGQRPPRAGKTEEAAACCRTRGDVFRTTRRPLGLPAPQGRGREPRGQKNATGGKTTDPQAAIPAAPEPRTNDAAGRRQEQSPREQRVFGRTHLWMSTSSPRTRPRPFPSTEWLRTVLMQGFNLMD